MKKWAVLSGETGEVIDTFQSVLQADEYAVETDGTVSELVENIWWIESDWTEDDVNYITSERNAAEFSKLIEKTGLKYEKIGEICGKSKQTICLYVTGKRNVPKLVIEKVQELDKIING